MMTQKSLKLRTHAPIWGSLLPCLLFWPGLMRISFICKTLHGLRWNQALHGWFASLLNLDRYTNSSLKFALWWQDVALKINLKVPWWSKLKWHLDYQNQCFQLSASINLTTISLIWILTKCHQAFSRLFGVCNRDYNMNQKKEREEFLLMKTVKHFLPQNLCQIIDIFTFLSYGHQAGATEWWAGLYQNLSSGVPFCIELPLQVFLG